MITHIDLFSGIGGFALAADWTWGKENVQHVFCEIEPFAQKVLKKHWPNAPIHSDIKEFKYDGANPFILTGGFPCQPFSVAGKQRGSEDDRALWPEMLRIIQETRPSWIVGENVTGIINMELDNILSDLEGEGYDCQPVVIPACSVDARHRRSRIWFLCHSRHDAASTTEVGKGNETRAGSYTTWTQEAVESTRPSKPISNTNSNDRRRWCSTEPQGRNTRLEYSGSGERQFERQPCEDVADTTSTRQQGQGEHVNALYTKEKRQGQTDYAVPECEPRVWPTEPAVGRVANGIPSRVDRLKGLGNAIVPQVAQVIMQTIKSIEEQP